MRTNRVLVGDARRQLRKLPSKSVHMVLTSPPYYGLRAYLPENHPQKECEIGQEKSPAEYVAEMVEVFREVRRVLRDDGCVFLNVGDSYNSKPVGRFNGGGKAFAGRNMTGVAQSGKIDKSSGLPPKNRLGIPHRLVFALQDDGWYWRDEIIWHKKGGMTSSVEDRTTPAHEMVFLLSKKPHYFFDIDAIMEPSIHARQVKVTTAKSGSYAQAISRGAKPSGNGKLGSVQIVAENRFPRSVWSLSHKGYKGAHFATMPPKLASRCIMAGTSEKGCCPVCDAPWVRIIERERVATRPGADTKIAGKTTDEIGNRDPERHVTKRAMKGWKAGCDCGKKPVPCVVLDPFFGVGTSGVVAERLGRRWIGCELYEKYAEMAVDRIGKVDVGFGLFGD